LSAAHARDRVRLYSAWPVVPLDAALVLAAVELHAVESLSFWDALIVRAASFSGCTTLYSEDLQPGRRFGSVVLVNPFAG
jgi:predicted nucleic acid-binding protein